MFTSSRSPAAPLVQLDSPHLAQGRTDRVSNILADGGNGLSSPVG